MSSPVQAPANDAAQANSEQPAQVATATAADPKLEIYARKERQLLKMRKEFEEQKKAWEQERSNYVPKSRFKEDAFGALADVDLDYQKLTETVLNQPNINDPTIKALQARVRAMEEAEQRRAAQAQEAEKAQAEQTRKQILSEAKLATIGNAEYELIEKWDAHQAVVELIEETFEKEGYIMDTAAALKAVEEHLLTEALKVVESNKIKAKLNSPAQEVATQAQAPAEASADKPKWKNPHGPYQVESSPRNINTLTNRLSQEAPKPASSEQDRRARAIAAVKGQLK